MPEPASGGVDVSTVDSSGTDANDTPPTPHPLLSSNICLVGVPQTVLTDAEQAQAFVVGLLGVIWGGVDMSTSHAVAAHDGRSAFVWLLSLCCFRPQVVGIWEVPSLCCALVPNW